MLKIDLLFLMWSNQVNCCLITFEAKVLLLSGALLLWQEAKKGGGGPVNECTSCQCMLIQFTGPVGDPARLTTEEARLKSIS